MENPSFPSLYYTNYDTESQTNYHCLSRWIMRLWYKKKNIMAIMQ